MQPLFISFTIPNPTGEYDDTVLKESFPLKALD